ncbi:hypothetical protein [Acutalibacter muris]|uniref:hypothetical protein n=1 Tax=Acutalibacter muris TaxID=1796620 RepID=UPI001C3ED27A|nr:hypothetical protein [Acutalibacter muris]
MNETIKNNLLARIPLHHSTAFDPKFSTVSTQFFRRVGRGVGQAAKHQRQSNKEKTQIPPQNLRR